MDLVAEEQRDIIFKEREEDLKRLSLPLNCTAFKTSIWDETLYKAWSNIVRHFPFIFDKSRGMSQSYKTKNLRKYEGSF